MADAPSSAGGSTGRSSRTLGLRSQLYCLFLVGGISVAYESIAQKAVAQAPALSRNRVADAEGLAVRWDVDSGENVLWSQALGSETYGGPALFDDLVLVGTNNEPARAGIPAGDRGVLVAFDADTGAFRFQVHHSKHPAGDAADWPLQGLCSTPSVSREGIFYVANNGELVSLSLEGQRRWSLDMPSELKTEPLHMSASSPVLWGDRLFSLTSHGPKPEGGVVTPEAPSFLAVDAASGEVLWQSALPGSALVDGQWSSPTVAELGGRQQVLFPGGDGRLYALDPDSGDLLWFFDANIAAGVTSERQRHAFVAAAVVKGERIFLGVGRDPESGSAPGHFFALEPEGRGDLTGTAVVWHFEDDRFGRTLSTVAIADGRIYVPELNGFLFALDEATGKKLWQHDLLAPIWSSPLVADGKVFVADTEGDAVVLKAAPSLEILGESSFGEAVYTSPLARDGVLYWASRSHLYALADRSTTGSPEVP